MTDTEAEDLAAYVAGSVVAALVQLTGHGAEFAPALATIAKRAILDHRKLQIEAQTATVADLRDDKQQ